MTSGGPYEGVVETLVAAIKDHREFRQLSCYSIECVAKALDSQNAHWRDFIERAIDCDAAPIILDILRAYPGHDDVLGRCTACLARLASDSSAAVYMAKQDGIGAALLSIERGGSALSEESTCQALLFVDVLIFHALDINCMDCLDVVSKLVRILEFRPGEHMICRGALQILERISKSSSSETELLATQEIIEALLLQLSLFTEKCTHSREGTDGFGHHDASLCVTKILLNLSSACTQVIPILRSLEAEDKYLHLLDIARGLSTKEGDALCRLGGRLLGKLVDRNAASIVADAAGDNLDRNLGLLLMISQSNQNDILKTLSQDDISQILAHLTSDISDKAFAAASRIVQLICSSASGAERVMCCDGVMILACSLSSPNATQESMVAALESIGGIVSYDTCNEALSYVGNIMPRFMAVLESHKSNAVVVLSIFKVVCTITHLTHDTGRNSSREGLGIDEGAVVHAMWQHQDCGQIQSHGTSLLLHLLADCNVSLTPSNRLVPALCELIFRNIRREFEVPDQVLVPSLALISRVMTCEDGRAEILKAGGLGAISNAMVNNVNHDGVVSLSSDIVRNLANKGIVRDLVATLAAYIDDSSKAAMTMMTSCLETLAALAMNAEGIETINACGGFSVMVDALVLAGASSSDEAILSAVMKSLTLVLTRSQAARQYLNTTNILSSSAVVLRNHTFEVSTQISCLRLVSASIRSAEKADIIESGVIESLSSAFKFQVIEASFAFEAIELLTVLSKNGLSGALSTKGIAHQVLSWVHHLEECERNSLLPKVLLLLEELCNESSSITALKASGSLSVILGMLSTSWPKASSTDFKTVAKVASLSDLSDAISKVRTELGKSSHGLRIDEVEKLVRKVALLYRCLEDSERENMNGDIMDVISKILEHASAEKRTRAVIHLRAACLETVCGFGGSTECTSILTCLAKDFFLDFKEAASMKLFPGVLSLIRNEDALAFLNVPDLVSLLLGIVEKCYLDPELAHQAVLALLLLLQESSHATTTQHLDFLDVILCVSEYLLFATEKRLSAGMTDALDLLYDVGRDSPHLLIDEHVLESLSEVMLYLHAVDDASDSVDTFVSAMKVICLIASSEQGLYRIESRNIPPLFVATCQAFCHSGQMTKCLSLVADLLSILTKSKSLKDDLCGGPLRRALIRSSRDCHLDRGHSSALAMACQAIQRDPAGSGTVAKRELDDYLKVLVENTSDDFIQVEIILSKCCDLLSELKHIDDEVAKHLIIHVQSILTALRTHDSCVNRGKVRSLSFTLLARVMETRPGIGIDEAFFIDECCAVDAHVFAASLYAFISVLVRSERGFLALAARPDVLCVTLIVSPHGSGSISSSQSVAEILADEIVTRVSSLRNSKGGVEAIARILSAVDDLTIARTVRGICGKVRGIWIVLDVLSLMVDARHSFPAHVAEVIVETIVSKLDEYFSGSVLSRKYINAVLAVCEKVHKAISFLTLLEKTEENVQALVGAGFLRFIKKCFSSDGDTNATRVATSILSECLAASPSFLNGLKDAGLAHALLDYLSNQAGASNESFVQDALHIIGSLISHYGTSALTLSRRHVKCVEQLSAMYIHNDYICAITADILSDAQDSLSRSDDVADRLGELSSILEDNQIHEKNVEGSSSATIELPDRNRIKDQLSALSSTIEHLQEDCINIDARLAQPLIDIIRRYGEDKDILLLALSILSKMGEREWLAKLLASNGGMALLIEVLAKHPADRNIVSPVLKLAIAFSSKPALELSPFESEEILRTFKDFASDHDVVVLMLKLMGYLTLCDANIGKLIDCSAVCMIVDILQSYLDHKKTLHLAILVLSNFGSMQNKQEGERLALAVSGQGGISFVMQCMQLHHLEPFLTSAALAALFNLSSDGSTLMSVATEEILEHSIRTMQWLDYDRTLLTNANKVLALFSSTEASFEAFHKYGVVNILLNTMQQHEQDTSLVELATLNLANILTSREVRLEFRQYQRRNFTVLLASLERHKGNTEVVKRILAACALLARSGIGVSYVAQDGLHCIIGACKPYLGDQAISSCFVEVIGHVSTLGLGAAAAIMQSGGVELLLCLLDSYSRVAPMVVGAFRVIYNLLGVSTIESNVILVEAGVENSVGKAMQHHVDKDVLTLGGKVLAQLKGSTLQEQQEANSQFSAYHHGWNATDNFEAVL